MAPVPSRRARHFGRSAGSSAKSLAPGWLDRPRVTQCFTSDRALGKAMGGVERLSGTKGWGDVTGSGSVESA